MSTSHDHTSIDMKRGIRPFKVPLIRPYKVPLTQRHWTLHSELSNFLFRGKEWTVIYSGMFDFLTIDAALSNIKRQALSILWKKPLVNSSLSFRLLYIKSRTTAFWKINYMSRQYMDSIYNQKYSNVGIPHYHKQCQLLQTQKTINVFLVFIDKRI